MSDPTQPDDRARKTTRRRVPRLVSVGLLILWLPLLLALLALAAGWRPDLLRLLIQRTASERLARNVQIGRIEGSLFGELALLDVSIGIEHETVESEPLPAPDTRPALGAKRVAVDIDWMESFARGELEIVSLSVRGARAHLRRDSSGRWQLFGWGGLTARKDESKSRAAGQRFHIARLAVHESRLDVERRTPAGLEGIRSRVEVELDEIRGQLHRALQWPERGLAELELDEVRWRGRTLATGALRCSIEGSRVELEALQLEGAAGRVEGVGLALLSPSALPARLMRAQGRFEFDHLDPLRALRPAAGEAEATPPLLQLAGTLEVRLANPPERERIPIDLHLELAASKVAGLDLESGQVDAHYEAVERRWQIEDARLESAAGPIQASGRGGRDAIETGHVQAATVQIEQLPAAWLSGRRVRGSVAFEAELSGAWRDLVGRLEARGVDLFLEERGPARVELALAALGAHRYRLESFSLHAQPSAVGGAPPRSDARPDVAGLDTEEGRHEETFHLRSSAPSLLRIRRHGVSVERLQLTWPEGALELSGGIEKGTLEPTHIALKTLDVGALGALAGLGHDFDGRISGKIDLSGPLRDPLGGAALRWANPVARGLRADAIMLEVDADARHWMLGAELTRDARSTLRIEAKLPRATLHSALALERSGARASMAPPATPADRGHETSALVAGASALLREVAQDERAELSLRADDFDLAWLEAVLNPVGWRASGSIDGMLEAQGAQPEPLVRGDLSLQHFEIARVADDGSGDLPSSLRWALPIDGTLHLAGRGLTIHDMHVGAGQHEAALDAALGWSEPAGERALEGHLTLEGRGFRGRIEASGGLYGDRLRASALNVVELEMADIAGLFHSRFDLGGQVSAKLDLNGSPQHPEFTLRASWDHPRVAQVGADRILFGARLRGQGDSLQLDADLTRNGTRTIRAEARVPFDVGRPFGSWPEIARNWISNPGSNLELQTDGFDLDWLGLLLPHMPVKTHGSVNGVLALHGARPLPTMEGEIEVRDGVFSISGQAASVGPLNGSLRFAGTRMQLGELDLAATRGRASIRGSIDWGVPGRESVDLRVVFEHFLFDQLGLLRTTVDGQLGAYGPLQAMRIGGALQMTDLRVSFPSQQDPVLKEIRVLGLPDDRSASIREGGDEIAGLATDSRADVAIVLPENTWVRGMGLDAQVEGLVRVTKKAGERTRYQGRLEVKRGRYNLQGRRFELERGVAMFGGETRPVPDLDILASRQAGRDILAFAHLTGPADAPRLELTSDPPLDPAEIISHIFLGGVAKTGGDSSSPQLGNAAATMAGAMLLDRVAPDLRERMRVDQISVTSNEGDEAPQVEIESQITPDVYLRLSQSLGVAADETMEVRWRFWRQFSFKSSVERSGASSIDLLWAYDFWGLEHFGLGGLREPPVPYRPEAVACARAGHGEGNREGEPNCP